ncbi:MAG: glycosyltransferase family 2 protein [Polyangiales bacterium]
MLFRQTIAVVIPAFNEAPHIARVVRTLPTFVDRIIIVDDASTDGTAARAETIDDARLVVLRHGENAGVGAAITTGYKHAFADGADVAAVMAGDAQMDPNNLRALLAAIDAGADYAKGNRLVWPDVWRDMPKARLAGNIALSWLTRLAIGTDVSDSQCGYTVMTREAAAGVDLDALWPRYGYPNDLLARLAASGARVVDVPVRAVYANEQSGVGWHDALVVVPGVLGRALLRRLRPSKPTPAQSRAARRPIAPEAVRAPL